MGRADMRDAITARIADSDIAGLGTAYSAFPKVIPATAFTEGQPAGQGWGVVTVTHLSAAREARAAIGGEHSGKKRIDYDLAIQVFLRWSRNDGDGTGATEAIDGFLDDLKDWIRSDRRAGTSDDVVWQWGEDLSDELGEPAVVKGVVEVWGLVRTTATQFINA